MPENPSEDTGNQSGNSKNPFGYYAHLGDVNAPKWLIESNAMTHKMIAERKERERKEKEEAEEKCRKEDKEAGASIKQEEEDKGDSSPSSP